MKLSQAIMMGRHLVKPIGGANCELRDDGGCALTMGMKAVGVTSPVGFVWSYADSVWPWLSSACMCGRCSGTYLFHVAYLFDHSVMHGKMTLEQLVDYVRSIEPAEPEAVPEDEELSDERPELTVYRNRGGVE